MFVVASQTKHVRFAYNQMRIESTHMQVRT